MLWTIWLTALGLYLLFLTWHDSRSGPLTKAEIDAAMDRMATRGAETPEAMATIRAFLEADDGKEFLMANIVKVAAQPQPDPVTGELTPGPVLVRRYFAKFVRVLLARGGYPALSARAVGGYIDAWNVPADPGWTMLGWMRYRSRRDMLALANHPSFQEGHPYKIAAMPMTFSFPTQPMMGVILRPRAAVALILALAAALAHIAALTFG